MKIFTSVNDPQITRILKMGGIGVLRTDTLYGIVARADEKAAVERIFTLKGRDSDKSPIVLVDSLERLYDEVDLATEAYLHGVWPGPVSVIVPSSNAPDWIRRQNESVAYRLPSRHDLRTLLAEVGPLVAPSANPQGAQPAMTVEEAVKYFGDDVDFYVDGGRVENPTPSQLVRVSADGKIQRLR